VLFENFEDRDLGHVSYIIADEDSQDAMIVDPKRDIAEYIAYLNKNELNLKYIFNSHTHADYIGGHLELVDIYPKAKNIFHKIVPSSFDFLAVGEDDILKLGDIKLRILETPGHTPFCISCIISEDDIDKYIFIGDILFVGDIARPDLLGEENIEILTNLSYKTATKIWGLDDDLIIFTSHIKGSLCGKDLKNQYFSTIGIEKKTNKSFKLSQNSKKEYIDNLLNQNLETPIFFKKMAGINIAGPKLLRDIKEPEYIKKDNFFNLYNPKDDYIIDFRHPNAFKSAHILGSINIYEYSNIILITGSLIDNESRLFLVGDRNSNFANIIQKLRRVGFDNIEAILDEDVNELDNLIEFKESQTSDKNIINLDTTKELNGINIEISQVRDIELDKNLEYDVVCKNGYKSMAVKSFLYRNR